MFAEIKTAIEFSHHLPRYREILGVLWKRGFGDVLKLMVLQKVLGMDEKVPDAAVVGEETLPVRLRLALEELGPTFIKFGQVLSSRRDLLPDDVYWELCKLQDGVPPFDGKLAKEIVAEELKKPVSKIFRHFDLESIGGASIAQVHQAELPNGKKVAIKVQRPDIGKVIELDLAILHDLASFADKYVPDVAVLNPVSIVEEFSATLVKELDFTHEAHDAERFRKQFVGNTNIHIPHTYLKWTTQKVLVMDLVEGMSVKDPKALRKAGIDTKELAERMTDLIYQQVFDHGFFHADPHPGNMFILPGGVLSLIDYGMMGNFTVAFRSSIANLLAGLARKDHQKVMGAILEMSEQRYTADPGKMLADVETFSQLHLAGSLKDINLGEVFNKLLDLLRRNKLRMDGAFYLGIKAFTQVESIGRSLYPDLNFIAVGEPYARGMIERKYKLPHMMEVVNRIITGSMDFLEEFPGDFRNLYQRIKAGKLSIPIEHKIDSEGFEPMRKTLDSIANRIAAALLTASVLICSGILILANMPPVIWGISLFGFFGLLWGGFMGLRLTYHIWRHGGL